MLCEFRFEEDAWSVYKSQVTGLAEMEWEDIVEEYCFKALTVDTDRLPALGGIARRIGESRKWTYVAGQWREHLARQLFWGANSSSEPRPETNCVPTWS
ncbi:hypothetical protein F4809DRAFT_622393 [Biscogniauxia mediterranea]|nr:hypothetical protein F4809DRAFT_622393 [Biscogniauxia mediterranea]